MFSFKSKSVVVFGVILLLQLVAAQNKEDLQKYMQTCFKEGQFTPEEIKYVSDEKIFNDPNVSEKSKCFVRCLYKSMGLVDDKGMYNEAGISKIKQEIYKDKKDKVPAAMNKCGAEVKNDMGCNAAFKFEQCMRREMM